MHYKRLQKYGKKLAVAILTSAVLLASGATVYADDTGEYLSQANTQEAEVTESTEDVATPAESESGEVESTTRNQEEQKNKATESEIQEEGKIQDVSEEQPESEVQIKEEKQPASESAAVPELNEEAQQPAVQSQEAQIAVQTQTVEAPHPGWNQSGGQTYYLDENMNRLTGWRLLGNVWYYFDNQGVMATGWRWIGGKWYYMNSAGAMQSGWFQDGQTWYYANGSGVMQKGWLNRGGTWYYLTGSGAMAANTWIGDYYVDGSGAWVVGKTKSQAGWIKSGNRWWYRHADGGYTKNGWEYINGQWYLFDSAGWMLTGWQKVGGTWYYMYDSGAMAANTWIGSYYVNGSGAWVQNSTSYPAGDYNVGTVYGPSLTRAELDQVAAAVQQFVNSYDFASMNDYQKVRTAMSYLESNCSYADDWSKNRANTAWGALVYHEAQCSGYARGLKALCDAIGIGCYYVHADNNSANPSHQWNEVCVNGQWYIADPQLGISTVEAAGIPFLMSESTYTGITGMTWDHTGLPNCPNDYR